MKNILRISVVVAIGFSGCSRTEPSSTGLTDSLKNKTDDTIIPLANVPLNEVAEPVKEKSIRTKNEFAKLNNLLRQNNEQPQTFTCASDKPTKITGTNGTVIFLNPADLVTENGKPIGKDIRVELKEITNTEQLLRANAQTVSNGRLLVSGGAYFINATSDGQQLKLKEGKKLSVQFPKLSAKEMSLFYGERDSLGKMNWLEAKQNFASISNDTSRVAATGRYVPVNPKYDSSMNDLSRIIGFMTEKKKRAMTPEERKTMKESEENKKMGVELYGIAQLNRFGWINCDRFFDIPGRTTVQFRFDDKDSVVTANVYLVFKDMNSIVHKSYVSFGGKKYEDSFEDVPVGCAARLIVMTMRNGKVFTSKRDLMIEENNAVPIILSETSKEKISNLFHEN